MSSMKAVPMSSNKTSDARERVFLGRRYLLTGASRGIGQLALRELIKLGAHVIAVARSQQQLQTLAAELGEQVSPVTLDLSQPEQVNEWAAELWSTYGPIDGVIHNAGVDDFRAMTDMSSEAIISQVHLNLLAPLLINRALLPQLIERERADGQRGVIVHMSSVAGLIPVPFGSVYSATKSGLSIYAEALAAELKSASPRFVTLHPGFVHGVGMHEAHKAVAGRAPLTLGGTTDQRVIRALIRALRDPKPGIVSRVVNNIPIRPLTTLYLLLPRLARALARHIVYPYLAKVAQARRTHGQSPMSETTPPPIIAKTPEDERS